MDDLILYPHFAKPKVHDGKAACPGQYRKRNISAPFMIFD